MVVVNVIILLILSVPDLGLLKHPWIFKNAKPIHYRNFAKYLPHCINGPVVAPPFCGCVGIFDSDGDCDIDLKDAALYERLMR